jgi:hypothetical protein
MADSLHPNEKPELTFKNVSLLKEEFKLSKRQSIENLTMSPHIERVAELRDSHPNSIQNRQPTQACPPAERREAKIDSNTIQEVNASTQQTTQEKKHPKRQKLKLRDAVLEKKSGKIIIYICYCGG